MSIPNRAGMVKTRDTTRVQKGGIPSMFFRKKVPRFQPKLILSPFSQNPQPQQLPADPTELSIFDLLTYNEPNKLIDYEERERVRAIGKQKILSYHVGLLQVIHSLIPVNPNEELRLVQKPPTKARPTLIPSIMQMAPVVQHVY